MSLYVSGAWHFPGDIPKRPTAQAHIPGRLAMTRLDTQGGGAATCNGGMSLDEGTGSTPAGCILCSHHQQCAWPQPLQHQQARWRSWCPSARRFDACSQTVHGVSTQQASFQSRSVMSAPKADIPEALLMHWAEGHLNADAFRYSWI